MPRLRSFFFLVLSCSVTVVGQGASSIAVIDSREFANEKTGITKYIIAMRTMELELADQIADDNKKNARLTVLMKEIELASTNHTPIEKKTLRGIVDELVKLKHDIEQTRQSVSRRMAHRKDVVVGKVLLEIGNSLVDFAKQRGYRLILDRAKDEAGFIAAIGDDRADVTKEFIAFHNARQ